MTRVLFVANWDWVLAHFRLPLARRLRDEGYQVTLCCPPGEYVAALRDAGFSWMPWQLDRRNMDLLGELRSLVHLARLLADHEPDVVHAFTIKPVVYLSLIMRWRSLVSRGGRRPRVLINNLTGLGYLFSNAGPARLARWLLWPLLVLGLRQKCSVVVLMNEGDHQRLDSMRVLSAPRTHLIRGTGVDTDRFIPPPSAGPEHGTRQRPVRVLFAARLLRPKGIVEYVAAAARLADGNAPVEFLVAGTPDVGNPDAINEEEIQAWHDAGPIRWLGHVVDLHQLLPEVDILAVPTYYPEGIPRILLEGAACSCGLVATDLAPCREVIDHGRNGLLVPPRDVDALTDAIVTLKDDPQRRRAMGAEARRDAAERFDVDVINDQWVGLYARLVEDPATPSS